MTVTEYYNEVNKKMTLLISELGRAEELLLPNGEKNLPRSSPLRLRGEKMPACQGQENEKI